MIEERVKVFLNAEFAQDQIPVCLEVPKDIPSTFIVFQTVARSKEDQLNGVTLEFRSYAPTKYEAALLDEKVRAAMEKLHETSDISCELGGGNDNPDTVLKIPRYRCYYNLFY